MAKSFMNKLNENKQNIKDTSLASENVRLREKIESLKSQPTNELFLIKLSEINLRNNIRDDEFNYNYEDINSLAEDIEKHGQLTPVLISQDKHLLAGFRRYYATKLLSKDNKVSDDILAYTYPKLSKDITHEELIDLQFSENNQRRDIDNFQLSHLYNQLIEKNKDYDQKKLTEKFKKSKSFISRVMSIEKIDPKLVNFLKQFQVYGWSEAKFNMLNFHESKDEKLIKEYENLKGNIGISKLTSIAKYENIEEQKKVFLKMYENRLSPKDIESGFFKGITLDKKEKSFSEKSLKQVETIMRNLESTTSTDFKESKEYEAIKTKIKELEKLLKKTLI